jgi:hypothetical protein
MNPKIHAAVVAALLAASLASGREPDPEHPPCPAVHLALCPGHQALPPGTRIDAVPVTVDDPHLHGEFSEPSAAVPPLPPTRADSWWGDADDETRRIAQEVIARGSMYQALFFRGGPVSAGQEPAAELRPIEPPHDPDLHDDDVAAPPAPLPRFVNNSPEENQAAAVALSQARGFVSSPAPSAELRRQTRVTHTFDDMRVLDMSATKRFSVCEENGSTHLAICTTPEADTGEPTYKLADGTALKVIDQDTFEFSKRLRRVPGGDLGPEADPASVIEQWRQRIRSGVPLVEFEVDRPLTVQRTADSGITIDFSGFGLLGIEEAPTTRFHLTPAAVNELLRVLAPQMASPSDPPSMN